MHWLRADIRDRQPDKSLDTLATQAISQSRTMTDGSNDRRWLCSVADRCETSSCQLSICEANQCMC
ncbi:MAG: hypothetical protein AAGM36_14550 [Cyanobacteria bacterium J06597_1]